MKRLLFASSILIFSIVFFSSYSDQKPTDVDKPNYESNWKKIDSLENKGLYRMALAEVGIIFNQASKDKNHNQVIKSVLYELKYNSYLEEDDYVLGIYKLNELVQEAPSPSKEILHSLIAEVYWGYYSSNTWKYNQRTNVVDVDLEDIRTWDLKRIAIKVRDHYLLSLANSNFSKIEDIRDFAEIASYTEHSYDLRPTLFDFLGHRALDFFKSNTFNVPGPAKTFTIDQDEYFESNSTFLNLNPKTNDSLNTKYFAVKIFQELTKFHLAKNDIPALLSIELERIKFVNSNSFLTEKEDKYYSALERMTNIYPSSPYVSEAWYEMAVFHNKKGDTYTFKGDTTYRWSKKTAVDICSQTYKKFPDAYGTKQCMSLLSTIKLKSMNTRGEEAVITQKQSKILVEYKNVDQLYFKIAKYDYKKINRGHYNQNKLIAELRKIKPIYSENLNLTDPGDFQNHSTEINIPELENGFYFLIMSSDPEFKDGKTAFSYMPMWVTDITYQMRSEGNSNEVMVSDRKSGLPLAGAQVTVTYEKYNYKLRLYEHKTLGKYTTDEDGLFKFNNLDDYYTYNLSIRHNGQVYAPSQGIYRYNYYNYQDYSNTTTHFFTDRKIYRPGQTIYFKGINVNSKGKERTLATEMNTTVYFYDVNGQVVAQKELTSNEFGSFEGKFTAPYGVLTGQMTISNSYGSTYFRVEEYKRPKFNVQMDPVEGEFMVNDKIKVTGFAEAFAGNRIDDADVKYRVTRSTGYSRSWWYWGWWQPYNNPKEISHGELVTNENGEFEVLFEALPDKTADPKRLPIFTYTIYADVTDINGETHSTSTSIIVGYQSLKLGNNISGDMNNQEDYFLRLSTTNLNGQAVNAKGSLSFTKLKTPDRAFYSRLWQEPDYQQWEKDEFLKMYPLEEYSDENNFYLWDEEKEVFNTSFNTEKTDSIHLKNYAKWEPGVYKYEAIAKDKNGIEVIDVHYFTVFNPDSKISPRNDVLWVKSIQNVAEPGETVDVLLGTVESDLSVYFDLEVNDKIIESKRFSMTKEQKKLSFIVKEEWRGNFTVHFSAIKNNRKFGTSVTTIVPYTNKQLDLEFSTFRNKLLPGSDEEWTLTIRNKEGGKETAELLATLYDASLDDLYTPNSFYFNIYQSFYGNKQWGEGNGMRQSYASNYSYYWNDYVYYPNRYFASLNYHGYNTYYYPGRYRYYDYYYSDDDGGEMYDSMDNNAVLMDKESTGSKKNKDGDLSKSLESSEDEEVMNEPMVAGNAEGTIMPGSGTDSRNTNQQSLSGKAEQNVDLSNVSARTNFNETAFFYPQLKTNENGDVKISFTIPESLTKWRFLGLAHTKDLKTGTIQEDIVTQKDLMVVPNAPRFLREGDEITISTKISNISEDSLSGRVELNLIDPFTEQPIDFKFKHKKKQLDFNVGSKRSTTVSWTIKVPYETSAVTYRIVAAAGNFSDGEENVLPILSNRMMVTESLPLPIRGEEKKEFKFEKLVNSGKSKTLKHHRYTLEFTSNPAWYAVQAMPYMMEYPYECTEQTFTRFYSNSIATHIMNSSPKIKKVIEDWGENSPEAFLSNLQKNQELKSVILEETPWVLDAQNEEQSKRNLAILLDMERMSKEMDKALGKIIKAQSVNGGWPWFPGMPESRYITQHIITGMGHLDHLGIKDVKENHKTWKMIKKGIDYMDGEIYRDYKNAKKWDPNYLTNQHIGYTQIQYMYTRSYFPELSMDKNTQEAVAYYKDQATQFWLNFNIYAEGMIALAAHRFEMKELSTDIVKSLKDRSIHHEEFGMYWKDFQIGYYWYQAPIETCALMIEMFDEVTDDQESVEELKIWLLKQKQTTNWKTTKQTTEAVYALLLKGTDLLANDELVSISIGDKPIEYTSTPEEGNSYQVKSQAGTGYFKTAWTGDQVKPEMGNISVSKATKGVAWGAVYWQYFEDLDKITFAETNLKLEKQLFLVEVTNEGEILKPINDKNILHVGEKVRVRIELRTDRNLEYVHMKDMRASGFEPIDVLSTYHYQDGLGYYQATKDAATNFFFDYIPKGTYVFEYDLRVQHKGDFSNGIATIQCMYAPEFTSHSNGIRVLVE